MAAKKIKGWRNPSVLALAGGKDPIRSITEKAQDVTLEAMDKGWSGPPFDPFTLSSYLGLEVRPTSDIKDARLITSQGRSLIEYNPNKSPDRIRYSVAHEIAHTFFPDYSETSQYRHTPDKADSESTWELELLCNMAAAELLMPLGTLRDEIKKELSIENILELRKRYAVSVEAILIRYIKSTGFPCAMFAATPINWNSTTFRIDYFIPSASWMKGSLKKGLEISDSELLSETNAIGATFKKLEKWEGLISKCRFESVGLPPYPGSRFPRVVGLTKPSQGQAEAHQIENLIGDALNPKGKGNVIIAHVVNDRAVSWAPSGFSGKIKSKYPKAQKAFKTYFSLHPEQKKLGSIHTYSVSDNLHIVSLIAQHGYGKDKKRRIRYSALSECLEKLADVAKIKSANVHMPRIGAGMAGGDWGLIEQLIHSRIAEKKIQVYVYTLNER